MKKISAIIQARLGSTRLPGKTLMEIEGESLLGHLVSRIKVSDHVSDIIIATTEKDRDDKIVEFAKARNIKYIRGSEENVLDRFYKAATQFNVENIVRVTPDCPMLDPTVMDSVISKFRENDFDYVSNTLPPTFPDGLDTEVFSFAALEQAWKEATLLSELEHVTPYIVNHPKLFRLHNVARDGEDLSWMRWTVDTPKDLEFVSNIFNKLYSANKIFYMKDIIELLTGSPELLEIHAGTSRNEGYSNSLLKDSRP